MRHRFKAHDLRLMRIIPIIYAMHRRKHARIFSESGQVLVQVMAAVAISGIVIYTIATQMSNASRDTARVKQKIAAEDIERTAALALSDPGTCSNMIKGTSPALPNFSPSTIGSAGFPAMPISKIPSSSDPASADLLNTTNTSSLSRDLKISDMSLGNFSCGSGTCGASVTTYTAILTIRFNSGGNLGGLSAARIPIKVGTTPAGGQQKLTTCSATASAGCTNVKLNNCGLPDVTKSGSYSGVCMDQTSGTCTGSCSFGQWTVTSNLCALACPSSSINSCNLPSTPGLTNNVSGTCSPGTYGSCTYDCKQDGTWGVKTNICGPPCSATTINNCNLQSINTGLQTGTCAPGTAGSCAYFCSAGAWNLSSNTCTAIPCNATTLANCSLPAATSGTNQAGSCVNGTIGSCAYTCSSGSWTTPSSNSCTLPPGCNGTTINNCTLTNTASGNSMTGTCSNGTTGSCQYACNSGTWSMTANSCTAPSCATTTVANCSLTTTTSGSNRVGTCANGTTGSCNYTCVSGNWSTPSSNTCMVPPVTCPSQVVSNCSLPKANASTTAIGACTNGTSGSCNYFCSATGIWTSPSSNSCTVPLASCASTTVSNCSLTSSSSGMTRSGTCVNGTSGSCSYYCYNGSWSYSSNSCTSPSPCASTTISSCSLTTATNGTLRYGSCVSPATGSCYYTCNNGSWSSASSNTCKTPSYPATCYASHLCCTCRSGTAANAVKSYYITYLKRCPDVGGWDYWIYWYNMKGPAFVIQGFLSSAEYLGGTSQTKLNNNCNACKSTYGVSYRFVAGTDYCVYP